MTDGLPRSARLSLKAPAKVNLALHVTGRRDDDYHLIDTLAVFAGTADGLEVAQAAETAFDVDGPFAAALRGEDLADNLVVKAARAMGAPPLAFRLTKNLPVAAGIGGGSADAAAALRLLAALIDPPPDVARLRAVALRLGADVPMCLAGVPLRARGIGEAIEILPDFPTLPLLLVNPRVPVPTGSVFRALQGRFGDPLPSAEGLRDPADALDWLGSSRNDLEAPAIATEPVVGEVLAVLRRLPGCALARMSGSGATCFGAFRTLAAAEHAAATLRAERPGWWIAPTETRRTAPEIVRSGG